MKRGCYVSNNCHLEPHEIETVKTLLGLGHNVELIRPTSIPNQKTADMRVDGVLMEMKSPKGSGRWVMARNIQRGKSQSENIIVDLRRCKRDESKSIRELEQIYRNTAKIKKLWIITKKSRLLVFEK